MKPRSTQAQTELLDTIATARKAKGLSQAVLAATLGMPQPQISRIERGLSAPQIDTLQNLAGALELQLMLVPRSLGPVVRALVQDYTVGGGSPAEAPAEERPLYRIEGENYGDGGTGTGTGAERTDAIE